MFEDMAKNLVPVQCLGITHVIGQRRDGSIRQDGVIVVHILHKMGVDQGAVEAEDLDAVVLGRVEVLAASRSPRRGELLRFGDLFPPHQKSVRVEDNGVGGVPHQGREQITLGGGYRVKIGALQTRQVGGRRPGAKAVLVGCVPGPVHAHRQVVQVGSRGSEADEIKGKRALIFHGQDDGLRHGGVAAVLEQHRIDTGPAHGTGDDGHGGDDLAELDVDGAGDTNLIHVAGVVPGGVVVILGG